jgi:hypothetical protein
MSEQSTPTTERVSVAARLPEWARPRESERQGLGSLRLAESCILILLGALLALATINDVVRQTHVNHRLVADLRSWRLVTGHDYRNLSVEQDVKRHSTRDTVCGNISPGGPKERTQVCVLLSGPVISGRRAVSGGYYLPPQIVDLARNRYACFGSSAQAGVCGSKPPVGAPPAPALPSGLP